MLNKVKTISMGFLFQPYPSMQPMIYWRLMQVDGYYKDDLRNIK